MPNSSPYFQYRGHPMFACIGPTIESLDEEYFKRLVDLARNHPPLFIDELLKSLLDPREHVRRFAAEALTPSSYMHSFFVGSFHIPRIPVAVIPDAKWKQAILALADRLSHESSIQVVSEIIKGFRDLALTFESAVIDAAIPRLISLVGHGDAAFQDMAVRGLREYGPEISARAIPSLIAVLTRAKPSVHREICETLGWLGKRAEPAIEALFESFTIHQDDDPCEDIARALMGIAQGPLLVSRVSDPELRQAFLRALTRIGPETRELRDSLRDVWGNSDTEVRSGQADRKADKKKNNWKNIPKAEVLEFARSISSKANKGRKYTHVAREFTEGDETKAQSLLRALRRNPHLRTNQ